MLMLLQLVMLASAQSVPRCNNDTMLEYAKSDSDLALTAAWARNANTDILLDSPSINVTMFMPTNEAVREAIFSYNGVTNVTEANVGQGDQAELAVYNIIEGLYSPEDLVNLTSVNSILGMLKQQDYVIKAFRDALGDLYLQGLTENNIVKVLEVKKTCNGFAYKVGAALLPAAKETQIFSRYGDGAIVAQIYVNGSNCPISIPEYVATDVPGTAQWQQVWSDTKMDVPLSNKLLAATLLVPQDSTSKLDAQDSTAASVMYNMISGQWCPGELESLANANGGSITKNSMLGEVTGTELPLRFTNESGTLVVSGDLGTARVLSHSVGCQGVILKTDVPLRPPPAAAFTPAPTVLPTPLTRHLTCNPVVYVADPAAAEPLPSDSSSSSSSTGLAIGLGVGLGCAVIAGGAGVFLYRNRKNSNKVNNISNSKGTAHNSNNDDSNTWNSVPASSVFASLLTNPTATAVSLPGESHHTARVAPVTPDVAAMYGEFLDLEDYEDSDNDEKFAQQEEGIRFPNDQILAKTTSGKNTQQLSRLLSSELSRDLWEIKDTDVEIIIDAESQPVELGRGSFGSVYRGVLRGVQPAAVKVLNASVGSDAKAAFEREAAILKHVNRDKNVVQLYGTSKMPDGKLLLVTELMEGGDLRRALNNPATAEKLYWHNSGKRVALDIARGLTSLHAVNVVHRDLKSKNVLLTDTLSAKVADVGIAAVHSQGYLTASAGHVIGTLAWSAPELLLGKRCTEKVDIYSLGIVLWEIATGGIPQRGFTEPPPPSERCPAELSVLILKCTASNPRNRPTAREVYESILLISPLEEA
ncbi:hypothetical protein Ndes2437A_g00560 [Nannochloris sp. 'desiccata']